MRGTWDLQASNWSSFGFLTNGSETVILYRWDGTATVPREADYFIWGNNLDVRTDKTGVAGYSAADTAVASQMPITTTANASSSYQRACYNEFNESKTAGNGVTNHNETSENLGTNWFQGTPSPGAKTPGSVP
jgi:hypothetical protein